MTLKNNMQSDNSKAALAVAVHVFFVEDKKVLLLKRANTGFKDGQWSVPAGRLEIGESISHAACREAKEEVGVDLNLEDLNTPLIMNHHDERGERLYAFFKPTQWSGTFENMELDKCEKIEWFDRNSLPDSLVAHVKHALEAMDKDSTYEEYGF